MSRITVSIGGGGSTDPEPEPEPAPEPNRSERTASNPFGQNGPTFNDDGVVTDDNGSSTPMGADPDNDGDLSESAAESDGVGTIPDSSPDPEPTADEDPLLHEDDAGRARAYVESTTDPMDPSTTPGGMSDTIEDANSDGDPTTTAVGAVEDLRDTLDETVSGGMSTVERAAELDAQGTAWKLILGAVALVVGALAFAGGGE